MYVSGMSGNEIWCLAQKGLRPGGLVVGNSVVSLGLIGGLSAGMRGLSGGELANVTSLISEGRHLAIERMAKEASQQQASGVSSVVSELRSIGLNR
ncbi:MAG: heavy metal-binding domain-containing protein [Verrucomicrobia bacterium]|nr:heavy metal-binding domain-containing protein [Leptolyngbya sp. ES-bin-22]